VAFFRHTLVQDVLEALEQRARQIEVRKHQAVIDAQGVRLALSRGDQDLQVLLHERIGGGIARLCELRERGLEVHELPLDDAWLQVEDTLIVPVDPLGRCLLRNIFRRDFEQHPGVLVALHDPGRLLREGGR
jgi:hypothetical protein